MWSTRLPFAVIKEDGEIIRTEFSVKIFHLAQKHTRTLSAHLAYVPENEEEEEGTILGYLRNQYRADFNWSPPPPPNHSSEKEDHLFKPILELPSIHFQRFYTVIGISLEEMEKFLCFHFPEFSLFQFLLELCQDYSSPEMDQVFPSTRWEISERISPNARRKRRKRKVEEIVVDPEKEEEEEEEEKEIRIETPEEVKLERIRRKNNAEKHRKRKFSRIIPVMILPLLLSRLPSFFQEVNIFLSLSEILEQSLRASLRLHTFQTHVSQQLQSMKHNRKFLSFQLQSSHHLFSWDTQENDPEYTLLLERNEKFQMQLLKEEYKEVEKICNAAIKEVLGVK